MKKSKVKIEIFVPLGSCVCSFAPFMEKIGRVTSKFEDVTEVQMKSNKSSEALKHGIQDMGIVINGKIKLSQSFEERELEDAISREERVSNKMRVLFLCEHNSVRSQMAEGLLRHLYGDKYEVFSAGSNPTKVNPLAIKVMAEIGIDISTQVSKSMEEVQNKEIDLVVSVCQSSPKLRCSLCSSPIVMDRPDIVNKSLPRTKHYFHHGFGDPSEVDGSDEEKTTAFRRTRDEIKRWIIDQFADPEKATSFKDP